MERLSTAWPAQLNSMGSQFISTLWKSLRKRLRIKPSLSTAFHPQIDDQTERANRDVKQGLRTYCFYMQDDWVRWLPMVEFSDNNKYLVRNRSHTLLHE